MVQCMAVEVVNLAAAADADCSMAHAIQDKQVAHTRGWELAEDVGMDRLVPDMGVAAHKAGMAENIQASNALQEGGYTAAEAVTGPEEHSVEKEHS